MPKCILTFSYLSGVKQQGPFFIRAKWGRDNFWCQNPHVSSQTKKDSNGNHVWTETIVIQSKFDWKKDSLVLHVFEAGFFSNTHVGDAQIQFNQLVLNQPTPVALALTQRLGAFIVPGKLHVQVKALDFGHEIVQVAPQPQTQTFQPHYFVASSAPLSAGNPAAPSPLPSTTVTLNGGQQLYIQPMMNTSAPNGGVPQQRGIDTSTPLAAMPTANGGYVFYSLPHGAQSPQPIVHNVVPNEPAPSYASLDPSMQYTADFTYEAPTAPTETVVNQPSHGQAAFPGYGDVDRPLFIDEQAPPPFVKQSTPPPSYNFQTGDSLI